MRKLLGEPGRLLLLLVVGPFYWFPLILWVVDSIQGGQASSTTLEDYPFWTTTWRTLFVSMLVAVFATVAAYPLALVWRFSGPTVRRFLAVTMTAPLILGLLARNYSWIGMLSSTKPMTSMGWSIVGGNDLIFTPWSVGLVMSCIFVPITFFILIQGISGVKANHILAARTCGAVDWRILAFLVIPMTLRAAVLSFGLVLAMAVGYFITPRMIGGGKTQFISNIILELLNRGDFSQASQMGLKFLLFMTLPVVMIIWYSLRLRQRSTGR